MRTFRIASLWVVTIVSASTGLLGADLIRTAPQPDWAPKAAAGYLDQRISWWMAWPKAARDHETFCISCHTALPYALSRSALHAPLAETQPTDLEQKLFANVQKRVRMWNEVAPFYPDQTVGLPKTSESRGTEAVLNALILTWRDAPTGKLSDDARNALDNMWALQLRSGEMNGAWAWLQFHNAPWEGDSQFWGTTLAALAVGYAPGDYESTPGIQPGLKLLRTWLQSHMQAQTPLDRAVLLLASAKLPDLLTKEQQDAIIAELEAKQRADGSFSTADLVGSWKRRDNTPLHSESDGYATGLIAFTLEQFGAPQTKPKLDRAIAWLRHHQNAADGRWPAYSLNKERDLESDAGRFMSDASTAWAVLAITNAP